jgi:hypothetical protein
MGDAPFSEWRKGRVGDAPFIVCAMFTSGFRHRAQRLAASLEKFGLAHSLFEVEEVHRSISVKGEGDLSVSKPRFIRFLLERFCRPVLYVDADMVLRRDPRRIVVLARKGYDFAIYNWLSDPMNDAWRPEPGTDFWKFYFRVDLTSKSQLMASGAVQFWNATASAFKLLSEWEEALRLYPLSEDDQCLDFAFNHGDRSNLKYCWLPKSYCRYAFWIYVEPVIDHPAFPAPAGAEFHQLGSERFDRAKLLRTDKKQPFPRQALINVASKQLLMPDRQGRYAPSGPLSRLLYLAHD